MNYFKDNLSSFLKSFESTTDVVYEPAPPNTDPNCQQKSKPKNFLRQILQGIAFYIDDLLDVTPVTFLLLVALILGYLQQIVNCPVYKRDICLDDRSVYAQGGFFKIMFSPLFHFNLLHFILDFICIFITELLQKVPILQTV